MNMKKILMLFAAVCVLFGCNPTHEDISNGGHITLEELLKKTTVSVPLDPATGLPGNVIICETLAPVNATWDIGGKTFISTSAKRKMRTGEHSVKLTALCADGTVLENTFIGIKCEVITDPLQRFYIYGEDPAAQPPFQPAAWTNPEMRFSDTEGAHFPTIGDDVYWGKKTLILDVSDATPDCAILINNGWWSTSYVDNYPVVSGQNEIQLTEEIAKDCAKGNGGDGKDLQFILKSGSVTVNSVYYEE